MREILYKILRATIQKYQIIHQMKEALFLLLYKNDIYSSSASIG